VERGAAATALGLWTGLWRTACLVAAASVDAAIRTAQRVKFKITENLRKVASSCIFSILNDATAGGAPAPQTWNICAPVD
jgi:hypothetical protein